MDNKILWVIIVLILIFGTFWIFSRTDTAQTPLTTQTTPTTTQTLPPATTQTPLTETQMTNEVVFDIKGENLAFDETELTVTEGDTVTINFESTEGFHDWVIDEFEAATEQVDVGVPTSVTFVADQVGEFEYYCSVGNHRAMGMVGTLVVEARQE